MNTDQPAHHSGLRGDGPTESRHLKEQGDVARIGIVRRSIADEIQVWNCGYSKSYQANWLE